MKFSGDREQNHMSRSDSALKKIRETPEKRKRLKIIKAVAGVEDSWAEEVMLESLADPCGEISDFIINKLAQRENLNFDQLYQKLIKPPWFVKNRVLKILGLKKNPFSVKHIKIVLDEPNVAVRKTAAEVLGQIGGNDSLELLAKLTDDKNPFVRKSAEEAILNASDLKFT